MGRVTAHPLRQSHESDLAANWPAPVPAPTPTPPPGPLGLTGPPERAAHWPIGVGALMLACLGLHIAAMFPTYTPALGSSIAGSPEELAVYIGLEVGWAAAAVLILGRFSLKGSVGLGAGLASVEIGILVADAALGFQGRANGSAPGIWLALAGLATGLAAVLLAASYLGDLGRPLPSKAPLRPLLTALTGIVAVAFFWPSWDQVHLVFTTGQVHDITIGDAFAQPTAVMAGQLIAGLAIGVVAILGAFWTPPQIGAWAITGTAVVLGSQVISGLVQVNEPVRQLLGPGNIQGLNIGATSFSLTTEWVVDAVAAGALFFLAAWAAVEWRRTQGRRLN